MGRWRERCIGLSHLWCAAGGVAEVDAERWKVELGRWRDERDPALDQSPPAPRRDARLDEDDGSVEERCELVELFGGGGWARGGARMAEGESTGPSEEFGAGDLERGVEVDR